MKIRGLFHIHTAYSHDGHLTPETIREKALDLGCGFAVVCDHAQDVSPAHYQSLRDDCEKVSDAVFLLIPGLEFAFGTIHLLGIGLERTIFASRPEECLRQIRDQEGLAVWAHPNLSDLLRWERWELLDGIEVWSARYGTKFAPSADLCRAVGAFETRAARVFAYAGLDAHRREEIKPLFIELITGKLEEKDIISRLRGGNFSLRFGPFTVSSTGELTAWQMGVFPIIRAGYRAAETAIAHVKRIAHRAKRMAPDGNDNA
jgi:hypothetical protein